MIVGAVSYVNDEWVLEKDDFANSGGLQGHSPRAGHAKNAFLVVPEE